MEIYASKEDYLRRLEAELASRGAEALSPSAVLRALDEADDAFETLQGRGKTPTSIAETLGSPKDRAEIVVARRLLRLRPGSESGPEYVTYLRVIRSLAIVSPLNLIVALVPVLLFVVLPLAFIVGCGIVVVMAVASMIAFFANVGGVGSITTFQIAIQFVGLVAGGIFFALFGWDLVSGAESLSWRWMRWNVTYLMREVE